MIGLQNYLMKNNSMDQRIALQILGKLVRSFKSNLLEEYLNVVKVHVHHQDTEVRRIVLDIFSKQYLESEDDNIKELSLSVLMVGLNDKTYNKNFHDGVLH